VLAVVFGLTLPGSPNARRSIITLPVAINPRPEAAQRRYNCIRSVMKRVGAVTCVSGKKLKCTRHEIGIKLEYAAMTGIGINDQCAVRKPPRQIARVDRRDHPVIVPIHDEHWLRDHGQVSWLFLDQFANQGHDIVRQVERNG